MCYARLVYNFFFKGSRLHIQKKHPEMKSTLSEDLAISNVMRLFNDADSLQESLDAAADSLFDGSHDLDWDLAQKVLNLLRDIALLACRAVPFDLPPVTLTPTQVYLLVHQCSMVAVRVQQTPQALVLLEALVTVLPSASAAPLLRGWILFISGKTVEATAALQLVVETPAPSVDAHIVLAIVCMLRADYTLALAHTVKAATLTQKDINDPRGWVSAQAMKAQSFALRVQHEIQSRLSGEKRMDGTSVTMANKSEWDEAVDAADVGNLGPLTSVMLESGSSFSWTVNDYHNASIIAPGPRPCNILHNYAVALYPDKHAEVKPLPWATWLQEAPPSPEHKGSSPQPTPRVQRPQSANVHSAPPTQTPTKAPRPLPSRRQGFLHLKRKPTQYQPPKPRKVGGDLVAAVAAAVTWLSVAALLRDMKHSDAQNRHRFVPGRRASQEALNARFFQPPPPPPPPRSDDTPRVDLSHKVRFVPKPPSGGDYEPRAVTAQAQHIQNFNRGDSIRKNANTTTARPRQSNPSASRANSAPPKPSRTPTTQISSTHSREKHTVAPSMPQGLSPPNREADMRIDPTQDLSQQLPFSMAPEDEYIPVTKLWKELQKGGGSVGAMFGTKRQHPPVGGYGPVQHMMHGHMAPKSAVGYDPP